MRFNDTALRAAVILPFLTLLLSGCGESPTGPAGELVRPTIGSRYILELVREEIDNGTVTDRDTIHYATRVVLIDTLEHHRDVYGFTDEQSNDTTMIMMLQYQENGDVRFIRGLDPGSYYLHPYGGGGDVVRDTIDEEDIYAEHTSRYEGVGTVVVDGRTHDVSIVRDVFIEGIITGGHPGGIAFPGVLTSYYAPALGFPVLQRYEIGDLDNQGNIIDLSVLSTLRLIRIEE